MSNQTDKIPKSTLLAYSGPTIPLAAMGVPVAVYIPPFYAQEMGLGLAAVGLVFMLARIWDVITDPILGVVSDRYPTRWGRRRHWIVLSVPIMLLATWQLFMPDPEQVTIPYLVMWMFIMYVAWTLLLLSHLSWGAELSTDYNERSRVQGVREIFLIIGAILVLALPSVIEQMQPENVGMARMAAMGWMIIILLPTTVLWAITKVGEKKVTSVSEISWKDTLAVIKQNRPMQRVVSCNLLLGISNGITASLFLFYTADILKLGSWSSIVLLLYFISAMFYVPIFMTVSKKLGKHMTLCLCAVIYAIGINVVWFIPEGSVISTAFMMVCLGLNMGVPPFLLRSMLGDVVDEDTVITGKQRTGLFFALLLTSEKIGAAAAIGVTYLALDMMGFVPGSDNNDTATLGFEVLMVVPALLLNLMMAMIMRRFPINQARQEHNRKVLEARQQSQTENIAGDGIQGSLAAS